MQGLLTRLVDTTYQSYTTCAEHAAALAYWRSPLINQDRRSKGECKAASFFWQLAAAYLLMHGR